MPQFTVNPMRRDPYKNFKFLLKWEGRPVLGVSKISALRRTTEVISHREGRDPSRLQLSPGVTQYLPLTLERGVTHDMEFEKWANKVHNLQGWQGDEVSLQDFRRDLYLELYNEAGQMVIAYKIFRCWPSEFTALPELDANYNGVAIQSLVLQNEGWEREYEVVEPSEPSFSVP
jgi:phage tail-like protein